MTPRLVAVFPSIEEIGGVQASAAAAWSSIVKASEGQSRALDPVLLTYGAAPTVTNALRRHASTRVGAAARALGLAGPFDVALFWHLSLLKLRPFLRHSPRRTALFLHGIEIWRPLGTLERRLVSNVDLALSNSAHTWERFLEFNPWAAGLRHEVVHLGLGEPVKGEVPSPATPPSALMIGRLEAREGYKGHREVIAAWPEVVRRVQGARLVVVGDGTGRRALEIQAREEGVAGSVEFLGEVSEERKQAELVRASAFLLPSRAEGFGLVYLEAMRLGRPCLVSDCDAGREVVNPPEAGIAVDPGDSRAVAEAITSLLSGGAAVPALSAAARTRYETSHTAAAFGDRLCWALSNLAGATRQGGTA